MPSITIVLSDEEYKKIIEDYYAKQKDREKLTKEDVLKIAEKLNLESTIEKADNISLPSTIDETFRSHTDAILPS